jgi:hypothetical protein
MKGTTPERIERWRSDNLACANIILHNSDAYGGEGSLMVRWARAVIMGDATVQKEWRLVA